VAGLTWEEYGRAIIEGLADLKAEMRDAKVESGRVAIQLSLLKERSQSVVAFEKRLGELEAKVDAAEERVNTYRRSLVAVGLTLLGVILLPIARAYFTTKGGG
jgi:uncharacterized coiled-coil protein SlyX